MILGQPTKLESQFRLTYSMILNLLRVESLKVEDMIKQSFFENAMQKALPEQKRKFEELSIAVEELPQLSCAICETDLERFYRNSKEAERDGGHLRDEWILKNQLGIKSMVPGRVLVISAANRPPNSLGVLVKKDREAYSVLLLADGKEAEAAETDSYPGASLPINRVHIPANREAIEGILASVLPSEIAIITSATIKPDFDALSAGKPAELARGAQLLLTQAETFNKATQIPEVDFAKIKDLDFQLMYSDRKSTLKNLSRYKCMQCPDLLAHVGCRKRS